VFLIFVSFGLSSTVNAQNLQGKFGLSGFGGLAFPMGDLADDDRDNDDALNRAIGPQFGATFEYFFIPNFGMGLQFNYISMGSVEYEWISDDPNQDDVLTAIMIGVHGKGVFIAEGPILPYGKFGFGMVMASGSDFPVRISSTTYALTDAEIDTRFYLQLGLGINFFVSQQVSLFVEPTYNYLMLDGAEVTLTDIGDLEQEIEANYSYFGLTAGISIWLGGTD